MDQYNDGRNTDAALQKETVNVRLLKTMNAHQIIIKAVGCKQHGQSNRKPSHAPCRHRKSRRIGHIQINSCKKCRSDEEYKSNEDDDRRRYEISHLDQFFQGVLIFLPIIYARQYPDSFGSSKIKYVEHTVNGALYTICRNCIAGSKNCEKMVDGQTVECIADTGYTDRKAAPDHLPRPVPWQIPKVEPQHSILFCKMHKEHCE